MDIELGNIIGRIDNKITMTCDSVRDEVKLLFLIEKKLLECKYKNRMITVK